MKHIIIILLVLVSVIGFSQSKNDAIDFKNVNHELLNKLIFDKCNEERKKVGAKPYVKDNLCKESSQYQCDYMANYQITTHFNDKVFRDVKLYGPEDRFDFFSKKLKIKHNYDGEIGHVLGGIGLFEKITYDELAQEAINAYLNSLSHKVVMLSVLPCESYTSIQRCESVQYGYFSTTTSIRNGRFNFYVMGILAYDFK
jgi:hypothetical protein